MTKINVNGKDHELKDVPGDTPFLWVLRDHLGLTGTKYGCGISECGACTVHLDGAAVQSCVTSLADVGNSKVVTIEGLSQHGDHPVQKAWMQHNVPQCGYCQAGQMMMAAALLRKNNDPSDQGNRSTDVEYLSLRNLSADSRRDQRLPERSCASEQANLRTHASRTDRAESSRDGNPPGPVSGPRSAVLNTAVFNPVTRRSFLAGLSAGSLLLMCRVGLGNTAEVADPAKVNADAFAPDLWVSIAPDGTVTILAHRSEMGTGIRTGLPRVLADELEADWSRVVIRQAQGDKRLGDQNTDGSNSIRFFFDTMRTAGAIARTMLERAAAQQWKVDPSECYAELHQVKHKGTGKSLGFGDLVAVARKLEIPAKHSVKFKPRDKWRYIGKDAPITDLTKIVTGRAVYGIDARLENQLFAVAARPPVVGGKVKSLDDSAAKAVAGVVAVIKLPGFKGAPTFQPLGGVAVCATSTWAAIQGREALKIEWEHGENASYDTAQFAKSLKETVNRPGTALRSAGDAAKAIAGAKKVIKADYSVPHLAHASMEPTCAVADVRTDAHGKVTKCYLQAATQNPQAVQQSVGPAMGIPNDQVEVDVTLLGSGFGRKSKPDYCVEAALLSRELKRPVHMTWTREDDMQHDYYHAISAIHCEAAVGDNGRPVAWLQRVAYPSIGSTFSKGADRPADFEAEMGHTDLPYDVPNLQLEVCRAKAHTRIGWLRSVCHIQQNFAVGSFVDELAHAAGRDPFEYLLDALGDDRMIDLAAAKLQ